MTRQQLDALAEVKRLAAAVDDLAFDLRQKVGYAAAAGAPVPAIADALVVNRGTYAWGLGELFPNGTSAKTVRRFYGRELDAGRAAARRPS